MKPGTHFIGGWVGPSAGLDRCEKSRLPAGFDPRIVQNVVSRYTAYAIPVHTTNTTTAATTTTTTTTTMTT